MRLTLEVLKVVVALSSPFRLNTLSTTEESGRASISRPRAKREFSALSATVVFSQAQRTTGTKLKSTYSR